MNSQQRFRSSYVQYLVALFITAAGPTCLALLVNLLVDPLWYLGGNRVFDENFPFNERFSKANIFLDSPDSYDCVILGSSRVTLLDPGSLSTFRCFNFAVSNGTILEYGQILDFIESRSALQAVVVGVDGFNFSSHGLDPTLPEFLESGLGPPPVIESYLSIDVLEFSLRSLVSRDKRTRFYDEYFIGDTTDGATAFVPNEQIDPDHPYGGLAPSPTNTVGPFFSEKADRLVALIASRKAAITWIGYVPPILSHHLAHVEAAGNLDGYLRSIWRASQAFDLFFDFSVPSPIASDPGNTYDGSHFYRTVNDLVGETLSGGPLNGSLALHDLDFETYEQLFRQRLTSFKARAYTER